MEFLLKRREDYAVVEYLVEHTRYVPVFEEYQRYEQEVGDDGYPLVHCGDCPFHHWMQGLAGYAQAIYHLNDCPNEVERLLAVMTDHRKATLWRQMLEAPARLLVHGHHLSSQMTPPPLFERYILPYYRELAPQLRARGKVLALHADNDTRLILSHIEQAGFAMAECFVTAPMAAVTLAEARAAWGDRVIIWGGVTSVAKRGQDPFVRSTLRAVPAKGSCPLFANKVVNGCSDLLVAVFGDRGRRARAAVGVAALPSGASVEVDMIVEIVDR